MNSYIKLFTVFIVLISLVGFSYAIVIDPNNLENLGPLCHGNKRLWITKIDGRGTTCMVYIAPCTGSERNNTLVTIGSYYEGIVTCDNKEQICMFIKNIYSHPVDIRYEIDDVTPRNVYIPLFIVSIACNMMFILAAIVISALLFAIGLYTGKKSKGITLVIPGDRMLINYLLADATNLELVLPL